MIMSMYKKICITNRHLVEGDFLAKIEEVASGDVDLIVLREKDLTESAYEQLAKEVLSICKKHGKTCVLHSFFQVAIKLKHPFIHLTMTQMRQLTEEERAAFTWIGVSTHSVKEAEEAQKLGADYITASHIFATKCKDGLEPKGLQYLRDVVQAVDIEVYALGGIHSDNMGECVAAGADGICMMSEYMK